MALQDAQAWATIAISLLTLLTLIALIIYTRETYTLRKAAQTQNERALRPIVMLEKAVDLPPTKHDANMPSSLAMVRNVGVGAAFNVEIEPLSGPAAKLQFHAVASLAAGDRQPMMMSLWEGGNVAHGTAYGYIQRMFHGGQLAPVTEARIRYADVNGHQYTTKLTFLYDKLTLELKPRFDGVEPEF